MLAGWLNRVPLTRSLTYHVSGPCCGYKPKTGTWRMIAIRPPDVCSTAPIADILSVNQYTNWLLNEEKNVSNVLPRSGDDLSSRWNNNHWCKKLQIKENTGSRMKINTIALKERPLTHDMAGAVDTKRTLVVHWTSDDGTCNNICRP